MPNENKVDSDKLKVSINDQLRLPCWLCGNLVSIQFTKKDKPYIICNNCGIQTFVRYGKAEDLLKTKLKEYLEEKESCER